MHGLLSYLNGLASKLFDLYDRTCCSRQTNKHFCFQCDNSVEPIIASFRQGGIFYDIEQIEEFIAYVAALEIDSILHEKFETCQVAHEIKGNISVILNLCLESFNDNAYIFDYNERNLAALESTNVLQEEYDENLSLGMPMHPIEEHIEDEDEREREKGEWDPPPSPSKDDSNSKLQYSMVINTTRKLVFHSGGQLSLVPVQPQTETNGRHWSRFERPGAREPLVPICGAGLVPVGGMNWG